LGFAQGGRDRRPITTAKIIPAIAIAGVIRNENAISLKLCVYPVLVEKPFMGRRAGTRSPPDDGEEHGLVRNDPRIARLEKPRSRSVPFSRVRAATIACRVETQEST
jgi:hypothetical protein